MHNKPKNKLRIQKPVLPQIKQKLILWKRQTMYQKEKLLCIAQKMTDYWSNSIWQNLYSKSPGFFLLIFQFINLYFSKVGYWTYYTVNHRPPPRLQWQGDYPILAFSVTVAFTAKAETPAERGAMQSSQWSYGYWASCPHLFSGNTSLLLK